MRLLCLLFFSLRALVFPIEFYSVGISGGLSKVFNEKPFELGYGFSNSFRAYTDYFYFGSEIGFSRTIYEDPLTNEILRQIPVLFTVGTSHAMTSAGDEIEERRYFMGIGLGLNQGKLYRKHDLGGSIKSNIYDDLRFCFLFEGGIIFNVLDNVFIGPIIQYRTSSFVFKDKAFSGNMFYEEYKGSSLILGLNLSYYWGLF